MLSICVPTRDNVPIGFAMSLANLTARLTKDNISYNVHIIMGSLISDLRTQLVKDAIKLGSEYILWLDSDMHFPSNVFLKLQSHKKDIVAATYSTRCNPQRSVAFTDEDNMNVRLTHTSGLNEVFAVGMGCMLVKTDVYKKLRTPWFSLEWDPTEEKFTGEDMFFCKIANYAGYTVYIDSDLSNTLGHYGTKIYKLEETHEYRSTI